MTTWTGDGNNDDFSNPANWSGLGYGLSYPTYGSIDIPAGSTVDVDVSGINLDNLTVTGAGAVTLTGDDIKFNNNLNVGSGETLVLTGGITVIAATQVGSGTVTLHGATLNLYGTASTQGTVNFVSGGGSNVLELPTYATGIGPITNFGGGDEIATNTAGTTLSLQSNGNGTYSLIDNHGDYSSTISSDVTLAHGYTPASFSSGDGNYGVCVCFLEGTLIAMASGVRAVEDISADDEVISGLPGQPVVHRVVWAGSRDIEITESNGASDLYPVRICQNALAKGVPTQDLLVTQDHCLFFEGKLIPARMLVNGRSIVIDRTVTSFRIYHIETEQHSIILANGVEAESYLDTGNRKSFATKPTKGSVLRFTGIAKSWEHDAAAPLATARETVEPLFRRIEARAIAMGLPNIAPPPVLSPDADLHLVTSAGHICHPVRSENGEFFFMLPADTSAVRVRSRVFRPSETVGPFLDDRRELGVLVGAVTQLGGATGQPITAHFSDAVLAGWQVREGGAFRWTNGDALLPVLPAEASNVSIMLVMQVQFGAAYPVPEANYAEARRLA